MKRAVLLFVLAAAADASAGEPPPLAGNATFADGLGQISFESGFVDIGVNRVRFDDIMIVNGVEFGQAGIDRIGGSMLGGSLTFALRGDDEATWLGHGLRLKGHFEHQKGDSTKAFSGETTATSGFLGISASQDGRAITKVQETPSAGSFTARVFGVHSSDMDSCAGINGAMTYDAVVTGTDAFADCLTPQPDSVGFFGVSEDGKTNYVIFAGGSVLSSPQTLDFSLTEARSLSAARGEIVLEGDYYVADNFVVSPSIGLTFGRTSSSFQKVEKINGGFARGLGGRTESEDAGIRVGGRATYRAGSGFEFFGSASGAVVRRKSEMQSQSIGGAALIFVEDGNGDGKTFQVPFDMRGAFLTDVTLGAAYSIDTQAIGPLRFAVSGGVSYDSDVATYGNVGVTPATDATAGPVTPAHIAYTGETTLNVKAEVALELP